MAWKVTDHEGRTCYERDGMRVFRTQDIEAIERQEKEEAEKWNKTVLYDQHEDDSQSSADKLTPIQILIIFGMLLLMIIAYYKSINL